MKRIIALAAIFAVVGCAKKAPPPSATTDINPQPPVAYVPATAPAPLPESVTPVPPEPTATAPKHTHHKTVASSSTGKKHASAKGMITGTKYTIKAGDTLSLISQRKYGTVKKVKAILKANPGLKADKLKVGQVITLP